MTIAVIPVRGRLPLLEHTIKQALKVVDKVVCVTDHAHEKEYCIGAEVTNIRKATLGKKWNAGFMFARQYDPDYVLYIGSSDWVSENWMDVMLPYAQDYELVGVPNFNLLHLHYEILEKDPETLQRIWSKAGIHRMGVKFKGWEAGLWPGYWEERKEEPIGIGRVLNRDYLKRVDYKPFDDKYKNSMDWLMYNKTDSVKMVRRDDIKCLSVSTSLWTNFHNFDRDAQERIEPEPFLNKWFPDAFKLTKWEEADLCK